MNNGLVKSTIIDATAGKSYVFCALCGIKREFRGHRILGRKLWWQAMSMGSFMALILYPWLGWKSVISLGLVALIYEFINMSVYRREVRCPHCGFDPIWYKKNWRLAKSMIQQTVESQRVKKGPPPATPKKVQETAPKS